MKRGRFITLEGLDGAGKSTSLEAVQGFLADRGVEVLVTREPGGTPLAEKVRGLLLDTQEETVDPMAETLLLFAARAQHVGAVIEPALARGQWVVSDRFTDATRAYQGGGRGVDGQAIEALACLVHPGLEPDLTFYLDVPVDQARRRIGGGDLFKEGGEGRGEEREAAHLDRFERERASFHERVRAAYRALARSAARVRTIDARRPEDEVARRIASMLGPFVEEYR